MPATSLTKSIQTLTTCSIACWEAREDTCRCYCDGLNHGILKTKDGVQPVRMRRIKEHVYHLVAVVYVPDDAYIATHDAVNDWLLEAGYFREIQWFNETTRKIVLPVKQGDKYYVQKATKAQFKWNELWAYQSQIDTWHKPFLIWELQQGASNEAE